LPTAAGTLAAGKVGPGALTAGAVVMANMLKISIAAALVVGAVAVWQLGGGLAAPLQPQATATVSAPAPVAASNAQLGGKTEAPRTVVDVAAFPGVDLGHPFEFALRCKVVDDHGLPVEGAKIALWPLGGADNTWAEATDATGTVTLHWRGRASTAHMALSVADGMARAIDVAAGGETTVMLLGESSGRPVARYLGFGSNAKAGLEVTTLKLQAVRMAEVLERRISGTFTDHTGELQPQRGMHPELTFADLAAGGSNGIAVLGDVPVIGRFYKARIDATTALSIEFSDALVAKVGSTETAAPDPADDHGTIAGTVFGEDGKPAANVLVCWSQQRDLPLGRTQSGDDGTFQLKDVPIGPVEVRAGGGRTGLARQTALVVAHSDTRVALTLACDQTIRGTVIGRDRAAPQGWWVEYEALDGTWVDRGQVRKDGSFVLPNLPGRPGRLWLHQNKNGLAAAVLPSVLPDSGPVTFDLGATAAAGSLHLRIPAAAARSEPPADEIEAAHLAAQAIKVLVWQQDTQLRATLDGADDGSFACAGMPAGFYRLEGGNAETGWCDLGTHYVDGKGLLDLGTVALPEPGVLHVANVPENTTIELYHRRQHGDVRALRDLDPHGEASLPPGRWLLFWRTGDGEPHVREFELKRHATTTVDLGG
jgi:hypothetical protein